MGDRLSSDSGEGVCFCGASDSVLESEPLHGYAGAGESERSGLVRSPLILETLIRIRFSCWSAQYWTNKDRMIGMELTRGPT